MAQAHSHEEPLTKHFSVREALRYGWEMLKEHLGLLVGATVILAIVSLLFGVLGKAVEGQTLFSVFVGIASWIIQSLFSLGFIYIGIRLYHGERARIKDLVEPLEYLWNYIAASILYGLVMFAVGFIGAILIFLLVGPSFSEFSPAILKEMLDPAVLTGPFGVSIIIITLLLGALMIYLVIRLGLYPYVILDREAGVVESLKQSWKITGGAVWKLLLLSIAIGFINLIGALLAGLGLLITTPIALMATTSVYFILREATEGTTPPAEAEA